MLQDLLDGVAIFFFGVAGFYCLFAAKLLLTVDADEWEARRREFRLLRTWLSQQQEGR